MKIQFNRDKPENYFFAFIIGSFVLGALFNFLFGGEDGMLVAFVLSSLIYITWYILIFYKKEKRKERIKIYANDIRIIKNLERLHFYTALKMRFADGKNLYKSNLFGTDDDYIRRFKDYQKDFELEIQNENGLMVLKTKEPLNRFFDFIKFWVCEDINIIKQNINNYDYESEEIRRIVNNNIHIENKSRKLSLSTLFGMINTVLHDELKNSYLQIYKTINYGSKYHYKKEPYYSFDNRLKIDEILEGEKYKDYEVQKG